MRWLCLLGGWLCLAQDPFLIVVLRGELLEWQGDQRKGEIVFRTPDTTITRCYYDERTHFENNRMRIIPSSLRISDPVQVLVDRVRWEGKCYARTVRVTDEMPPAKGRLQPYRLVTEHIVPRGSLTYAGVVIRRTPEHLVLQTRNDGRLLLRLREDTRYLGEGLPVDASKLLPNTRVYVHAGRSYAEEFEAYQVTWGQILRPD
jgi:hypothetical protein